MGYCRQAYSKKFEIQCRLRDNVFCKYSWNYCPCILFSANEFFWWWPGSSSFRWRSSCHVAAESCSESICEMIVSQPYIRHGLYPVGLYTCIVCVRTGNEVNSSETLSYWSLVSRTVINRCVAERAVYTHARTVNRRYLCSMDRACALRTVNNTMHCFIRNSCLRASTSETVAMLTLRFFGNSIGCINVKQSFCQTAFIRYIIH